MNPSSLDPREAHEPVCAVVPNPNANSVPGGPLGRYLLHPGQETSNVAHHVLRVLAAVGRVAAPVLLGALAVVVVGRLVLAVLRRATSGAGTGHVVVVSPGPEVEPAGAEALWNGLHGVLHRRGWRGVVSGRPHIAFEVGSSAGRLCFGLWVPAGVPALRVARVAEAAWPGAVTEVVPATAPLEYVKKVVTRHPSVVAGGTRRVAKWAAGCPHLVIHPEMGNCGQTRRSRAYSSPLPFVICLCIHCS